MLVTDRRRAGGRCISDLVRAASAAHLDFAQVRERDLPDGALLRAVGEAVQAASGRTRVLVNGRPDVAEAAGAAGVQLPEEGLPAERVRRAFPRLVIGASCHSLIAARRAADAGADLIVVGPIYATPGKEDRASGVGLVSAVAAAVRVPVYAIGGITPEHASQLRRAGASGLAAIRLFLEQPIELAAASLRRGWASG